MKKDIVKRFTVLLVALALATRLPAQQPGDSIRVWNENGNMVGRLVRQDSLTVTFREGAVDRTIPRSGVQRIDVWERRDPAGEIALSAVLGALLFLRPDEPVTAGRLTAGIAVGAALGLASGAVWPGRWRRLWRR